MSESNLTHIVPLHREILRTHHARKREKNPHYSLRAYARFLNLDASALSRILAGKQEITTPVARKMLTGLELQGEERETFLKSLAQEHLLRASEIFSEWASAGQDDDRELAQELTRIAHQMIGVETTVMEPRPTPLAYQTPPASVEAPL